MCYLCCSVIDVVNPRFSLCNPTSLATFVYESVAFTVDHVSSSLSLIIFQAHAYIAAWRIQIHGVLRSVVNCVAFLALGASCQQYDGQAVGKTRSNGPLFKIFMSKITSGHETEKQQQKGLCVFSHVVILTDLVSPLTKSTPRGCVVYNTQFDL